MGSKEVPVIASKNEYSIIQNIQFIQTMPNVPCTLVNCQDCSEIIHPFKIFGIPWSRLNFLWYRFPFAILPIFVMHSINPPSSQPFWLVFHIVVPIFIFRYQSFRKGSRITWCRCERSMYSFVPEKETERFIFWFF